MYIVALGLCNPKDITYLRMQEDVGKVRSYKLLLPEQVGRLDLVRGIPKLKFTYSKVYEAHVKGK